MTDDKPPFDPDNPLTPMEQTVDPSDLDALRAVANEVAERRVPRRPTAPEPALDDTTLPDGNFPTEPDSEDVAARDLDSPQTPLEPTLDPSDLDDLRAAAASISDRTPLPRPKPPSRATISLPPPVVESEPSSPAADERPGCLNPPPRQSPQPDSQDSFQYENPPEERVSEPVENQEPPVRETALGSSPAPAVTDKSRMWQLVMPTCFLLAVVLLLVALLPMMRMHWLKSEAVANADAVYLKRRAELKAEAESATERLTAMEKLSISDPRGFPLVVEKVTPAVVNIANLKERIKKDDPASTKGLYHDPAKNVWYEEATIGSGLLYAPGYLITNHHVVKGADRLRIIFSNSRVVGVDASAVVSDPLTDLAVVKLPTAVSNELKDDMKQTAAFANSDKDVRVGDWALAIGSPKNLRHTTTLGIISAKGRLIDRLDMVELIQTDAAINHGSSGGPLFDYQGRVVGIIVALANDKGVDLGIGFAIPSNTVKKVASALIERGEVSRGYLGIGMDEFPAADAALLGIGGGAVIVTQVLRNDAGDKAGVQAKDIIVKINGEPLQALQAVRHLRQMIADLEPEKEAILEIYRDNRRRDLKVMVGKRPLQLPTP